MRIAERTYTSQQKEAPKHRLLSSDPVKQGKKLSTAHLSILKWLLSRIALNKSESVTIRHDLLGDITCECYRETASRVTTHLQALGLIHKVHHRKSYYYCTPNTFSFGPELSKYHKELFELIPDYKWGILQKLNRIFLNERSQSQLVTLGVNNYVLYQNLVPEEEDLGHFEDTWPRERLGPPN